MPTDNNTPLKVSLLATPHLADGGSGEDREAEVKDVVDRLSGFNPEVVAVEVRPKDEHKVQVRYERFLEGTEPLGFSEIDQIAFRLAQVCGVPAIRGFDADWQLEWSGLRKLYPDDADLERLMSEVAAGSAPAHQRLKELITSRASLREQLILVNSSEFQGLDHQFYVRLAEVGDPKNSGGAEYAASWYLRNLRMYANLVRIARPVKTTLALVGAGHAKILNDLLRHGGRFDVVDPLHFLT